MRIKLSSSYVCVYIFARWGRSTFFLMFWISKQTFYYDGEFIKNCTIVYQVSNWVFGQARLMSLNAFTKRQRSLAASNSTCDGLLIYKTASNVLRLIYLKASVIFSSVSEARSTVYVGMKPVLLIMLIFCILPDTDFLLIGPKVDEFWSSAELLTASRMLWFLLATLSEDLWADF